MQNQSFVVHGMLNSELPAKCSVLINNVPRISGLHFLRQSIVQSVEEFSYVSFEDREFGQFEAS